MRCNHSLHSAVRFHQPRCQAQHHQPQSAPRPRPHLVQLRHLQGAQRRALPVHMQLRGEGLLLAALPLQAHHLLVVRVAVAANFGEGLAVSSCREGAVGVGRLSMQHSAEQGNVVLCINLPACCLPVCWPCHHTHHPFIISSPPTIPGTHLACCLRR